MESARSALAARQARSGVSSVQPRRWGALNRGPERRSGSAGCFSCPPVPAERGQAGCCSSARRQVVGVTLPALPFLYLPPCVPSKESMGCDRVGSVPAVPGIS